MVTVPATATEATATVAAMVEAAVDTAAAVVMVDRAADTDNFPAATNRRAGAGLPTPVSRTDPFTRPRGIKVSAGQTMRTCTGPIPPVLEPLTRSRPTTMVTTQTISNSPGRAQRRPSCELGRERSRELGRAVALCWWLVMLGGALTVAEAGGAESWQQGLQPFFEQHCIECHQGSEAGGGLDLSELGSDLADVELTRRWTLIHDRLATGEMPPDDQQAVSGPEKKSALQTLSAALTDASETQQSVVLRRLNRIEYENTVRDLFDVHVRVKNLLPADAATAGFDNVGEGLAVSAEAMKAYLGAADVILDAVFGPPGAPHVIQMKTSLREQQSHDGKPALARHYGKMFRVTEAGLAIFQSGYCPTNLVNFARLRPTAGTYRATFRVRAIQSAEPVTLRIYGGDTIVGRHEKHLVGYYDIPPDQWTTIEFEDRLVEDGGTYQPKCYGTDDARKDADTYPEPGLEIAEITIEGPIDPWPPRSRALLLRDIDPQQGTLQDATEILRRLLPGAFRRPTTPSDLVPYVELVETALAEGRSFIDALRLGIKALLCSPDFLFLDEPGDPRIDQHALAARLSYFLWSSMPDQELDRLATEGRLGDPETLRRQVERLLNDPKAKSFTTNFTGQWLDLREIDFTSPSGKLYPEFDELLKISMVEETERFFQEMLDHDLSVMNFIDSDFAILNERLAKHYGIEGVRGQAFRRVDLPDDSVRGGLLTQASVLKVTANGTNTSPVLRGAWIMDRILGQPSPPPPSDAPAIEPDIRGATTLREQLAKHRSEPSCAVCHRNIDPPGFALENFNVIGGWRETYRTLGEGKRPDIRRSPITHAWITYKLGLPVDATGETAGGEPFHDIREFKHLLQQDRPAILAGLVRRLLTYSLGRPLVFADREAIKNLVADLGEDRDGLRRMVHAIVQSTTFQSP